MSESKIETLVMSSNRVVVQVPGRQYPGVVVQGDTLFVLYQLSRRILERLQAGQTDEAEDYADQLNDDLGQLVKFYEETLEKAGIELPYFKAFSP